MSNYEARKDVEQSTIIMPLQACKLYSTISPTVTSRLEVSVINGVKVSFGAHMYNNNQYKNVTSSLYAIDLEIVFAPVLECLASGATDKTAFNLTSVTSYDNNRKEAGMSLIKRDTGIWELNVHTSAKGNAIFQFTGIKNSTYTRDNREFDPALVSRLHLQTWIKTLIRVTGVAMAIIAHEQKRELPPRGQTNQDHQ